MKLLRLASFALAMLTLVALAIGVALVQRLGPEAASGAGAAAADALPLIFAAEAVKIATAALTAIAVSQASQGTLRLVGWLSAGLLAASALCGIAAIAMRDGAVGSWANPVGIASLVAAGLWAALLASRAELPVWVRGAGYMLAIAAIATVALPPVGMLAALVSIAWWVGVGLSAARLAKGRTTA